jgi:hypothetical protein
MLNMKRAFYPLLGFETFKGFGLWDVYRLAAKIITNEEGKKMQAVVWGEILEVLTAKVPEVRAIANPKS